LQNFRIIGDVAIKQLSIKSSFHDFTILSSGWKMDVHKKHIIKQSYCAITLCVAIFGYIAIEVVLDAPGANDEHPTP
jgi:hypothetical protein